MKPTTERDLDKMDWVDLGIHDSIDLFGKVWPAHLPDGRRFQILVERSCAPRTTAKNELCRFLRSGSSPNVKEVL